MSDQDDAGEIVKRLKRWEATTQTTYGRQTLSAAASLIERQASIIEAIRKDTLLIERQAADIETLKQAGLTRGRKWAKTNVKLCQAQAEIERLRAINLAQSKQVAEKLDEFSQAQAEIERQAAEIRQLRSELSGRLGQPFGDPAKS